jgi:hypothetical protein
MTQDSETLVYDASYKIYYYIKEGAELKKKENCEQTLTLFCLLGNNLLSPSIGHFSIIEEVVFPRAKALRNKQSVVRQLCPYYDSVWLE